MHSSDADSSAQNWLESGSHTIITNNDTQSKGAFTERRCWNSSQCFLKKGGHEKHPKHILKISCKSSFPYTRRARTLIRKKLIPHTYLHNINQLCRFPSPAKPLQSWQEGKAALLRWKWSLPDSLSSAPQLRNVPVPHESPNGFNKWQPSSQNPYMDSWALPALRGRWGDHGEAQGWGSSKSWLFWGLPA